MKNIITRSPEETVDVASRLAKRLDEGDFVALVGELGSGKTMFVKGLAKGLGVEDYTYVNSPSFVVLKEYTGEKSLYHFDVYRLDQKSFCDTLDYERYFYNTGITVVEWADKLPDILPEEYLLVKISYHDGDKRRLEFKGVGERLAAKLDGF